MTYSFSCPAPDCGQTMTVQAQSEEEAIDKLMMMGAEHGKEVHPDMPQQSHEEAHAMVRNGMKQD